MGMGRVAPLTESRNIHNKTPLNMVLEDSRGVSHVKKRKFADVDSMRDGETVLSSE